MYLVLKKGLYCEGFGYLPPLTELVLPPDSVGLGERLIERGYATDDDAAPEPEVVYVLSYADEETGEEDGDNE